METLVQAFKEPFIWYWDSARACILKERKPFQHRRNIIKEWYDAKTNELITDCYRRYSEIKKKDGKYAAEIARKGWVEKERAVEWDEYRYLKIWEVSETVFGCSYLGGYECPPVACSNTFPYKSIEEAIEKLYEYWEVYKTPRHAMCDFLHIDGFHPMCSIVMHRLGINKSSDSLYSDYEIDLIAHEVKNATNQYYLWWGSDGTYGNDSFRNSLGLSPTVDIEKALSLRLQRLYVETIEKLRQTNLCRIEFAKMKKEFFDSTEKGFVQGELF